MRGKKKKLQVVMYGDVVDQGIGLFNADGQKNIDLTVNLNGHKFTCASYAIGNSDLQPQAFHLEKNNDVTLKNGVITVLDGADVSQNIHMLIQNYSNLTLDNMVLDAYSPKNGDAEIFYALSNNFGNIKIKDTKIYAAKDGIAFDAWFGLSSRGEYDKGLTITIEGKSLISGNIEYGCQAGAPERVKDWTNKTKIVIKGGHFTGKLIKSNNNYDYVPNIEFAEGVFTPENFDYYDQWKEVLGL